MLHLQFPSRLVGVFVFLASLSMQSATGQELAPQLKTAPASKTAKSATEDSVKTEALLSIDRIYKNGEFGSKSVIAQWFSQDSPDAEANYTTLQASEESKGFQDIVLHDVVSRDTNVLVAASDLIPPGESKPLRIQGHTWSQDKNKLLVYTNSKRVWRSNTRGDYWVLDRSSRQLTKLGGEGPASTMMFAKFSPSGKQVAFVRERNIYVEDLFDHSIVQLTHTQSDDEINGTTEWVYEEEFGLRDAFLWSPDGQSIAYWQLNTSGVQRFPLVNNTDSLYPTVTWFAYPKVGQRNPMCRVGVVDIQGQSTRWINVPGDLRDNYIPRMQWIGESNQLLIQQLNRLQNTNRLFVASATREDVRPLMVEKDEAWVDVHDEIFWNDDATRFTWLSDRDGWRHVYTVDLQTGESQLVTPGEFDVVELLHWDQANDQVYFIASPDNPTERYLWRASLDGNDVQRVSPQGFAGVHSYKISPDAKWAVHTRSSADTPPITQLVSLPEHQVKRVLEDNHVLVEKLNALARTETEYFSIDIGDDIDLYGWCIKPPKLSDTAKHPLLCYVYGEPAGSTVVNRWGGNSYLWHLMLAQKGYVVMSFDNRGTKSPRGRAFRKSIYKKIGILPPADQAAAVEAVLKERTYLDRNKVAVWGWSGGGSSSLQAIFKYPDLYNTAMAVAPVPNQRYYDTVYQERYMSLPELNVKGFTEGSAINFAKQLQGNLLLVHGTADDNCHYQTTEMLIDELIAHNKQFTMFAYPNRTHAVSERKNTTRHLRQMMADYLLDKMPPNN
ncbi:S9 family peptidase [Planctomycetes bacterium K23_9]|uniref:Prolyl tripeptidyl peptidase n=1 Tax=Stieleria marina TaxID=1930275 RepID=A0A517NXJ1_9BACT|nr:Prolyl tripeptidyl peptidase precursor [Planctomycetes bacterium K23_9]